MAQEDMQERVEALETIARDQMAEIMVLDMAVKALISAHPNRETAAAAFQVLLTARESQLQDRGFDTGRAPTIPMGVVEELRRHADGWIRFFRG